MKSLPVPFKYTDSFSTKNQEEDYIANCVECIKPETAYLNSQKRFQVQRIDKRGPKPHVCNHSKEISTYNSVKTKFPFFIELYETCKKSNYAPGKHLIQCPRPHPKEDI